MMEFLTNNWTSIIVVLLFIVVVVWLALRGKKQIIYKMLYALVTEAEKKYGEGTGSLKFAYVLQEIYARLPMVIKIFISYDTLEGWIETALAEAKVRWAKEAGLTEYTTN